MPGGNGTDPIRERLRGFAFAPGTNDFDGVIVRRRARQRRRRKIVSAVAAVFVVLALAGGVLALVLQGRLTSLEYADQTPSPSPTVSTVPFAPEPKQFEGLPTGSVGSILSGLRIDDITMTVVDCGPNKPCPDTATITVTNIESVEFRGIVFFSVYRNRSPSVSDGASVTLEPGASTAVSISVQPQLSSNYVPGQGGSRYTWNISVDRQ